MANCYNQPSSGAWHHLAFVFDKSKAGAAEVSFYLDGVLQTATRSLLTSTNTNNFGSNPIYVYSRGGTTEYAPGIVDETACLQQRADRHTNPTSLFGDFGLARRGPG